MSNKTLNLNNELLQYLLDTGVRESSVLQALRTETLTDPRFADNAQMQIAPEQGQLISLLVKLTGASRALEIGTFTGYSSICIASALPQQGRLVCCDLSEEWCAVAQKYWHLAGLAEKITLHIAPALATLQQLLSAGDSDFFDFIFIDADKTSYDSYYEASLKLLRPGGLVVIDNVLWKGRVIDPQVNDADTLAIRRFNLKLHEDQRVDYVMVPVADGLSLCLKR